MEINVSVRAAGGQIEASVVEIPVSQSGVLSYEEKYLRGGGGKKGGPSAGMASLTRVIDPSDLDPALREQVVEFGKRSFSLLGCSGVARLDFIVDLETGRVYFNELNAFPGSCAFYLWAKSHPRVLYTQLIDDMVATALSAFATNCGLERNIGLKALK
jgi:D-alanine-D-alanine ligase